MENCFAERETALICIDKEQWEVGKNDTDAKFRRDCAYLESVFNRNFIMKKSWRLGGITKLI